MTGKVWRRRLLPVVIVLAAAAVTVVLVKLKPKPPRRPPHVPTPLVTVHEVEPASGLVTITGHGSVVAKRSIALVPQVGGKVAEVSPRLQAGAFFEEGDVLLRIEAIDYELAVRQAHAQLAEAQYNLAISEEEARLAKQEWERTRADALEGSVLDDARPNQLVFREPQLQLARAGLDAAKAGLAQAELNLDRCTLRAPFAGRVIGENVDVGKYVVPGEVLTTISATDMAEVTVSLPDADLAWVDVPQTPADTGEGTPVTVTADFAGAIHTWEGRAVRTAGAVDRSSRLVPVVVEIAAPYEVADGRPPLVEGMFVQVVFHGRIPDGAVVIPRSGLRPGNLVWLAEGDHLRIRPVTVARAGIEKAVISAGLEPGALVITSNLQYVVDGMAVKTDGTATALTAAGGRTP